MTVSLKVLVLCTGNSCRSQMMEGFLKQMAPTWKVRSAGTKLSAKVHPMAIAVMLEKGINLSTHGPQKVDLFLSHPWDLVLTLCGGAKESCPAFTGTVGERKHIGFKDPAAFTGSPEEILEGFRSVRDQIEQACQALVVEHSPAIPAQSSAS